jgi:hypothetical protein
MTVETIEAKGTNGTVYFDGLAVALVRPAGPRKEIPARTIHAVQWKSARLRAGYLSFALDGDPRPAGWDPRTDENTITFRAHRQAQMQRIRGLIELATILPVHALGEVEPDEDTANPAVRLAQARGWLAGGWITREQYDKECQSLARFADLS